MRATTIHGTRDIRLTDVPDPTSEEDRHAASAEAQVLVEEALDSLSEPLRAVFVMYHIRGHAVAYIARAIGIPENTASSRLRLARQKFKVAVHRARLRRGTPWASVT